MNVEIDQCQCSGNNAADQDGWEESVICKHCLCLIQGGNVGSEANDTQVEADRAPVLDDISIYQALKDMSIFQTSSRCTRLRLQKALRKRQYPKEAKALVSKHGIDVITTKAEKLLRHGAFTDTEVAKGMFPDLFTDPIYLPLIAQQPLIASIRRALTYASFEYVQRHSSSALDVYGWGCPDAAELEPLLNVIRGHSLVVGKPTLSGLMDTILDLFEREQMELSKVKETMRAAESFLDLLGVESGKTAMKLLRADAEYKLEEFITQSSSHQTKKRDEMKRSEAERTRLEQKAKAVVKALQDEERVFGKDVTRAILQGAHRVDVFLMDGYFGDSCITKKTE